MKKKTFLIIATMMLMAAPTKAQIVILDDDEFNRATTSEPLNVEMPGVYNSGEDWFSPLGDGAVLLAGLAGAYLLGRRKKKEE